MFVDIEQAEQLLVNPGGSEGMSMVCKKSLVEPQGASPSNLQPSSSQPRASMAVLEPTNSASAKRPHPVPLQPALHLVRKACCFGDR